MSEEACAPTDVLEVVSGRGGARARRAGLPGPGPLGRGAGSSERMLGAEFAVESWTAYGFAASP